MASLGEMKVDKTSNTTINLLSIIIPLVVALLLGIPTKLDLGGWTKSLPHVIGTVNTLTTIALVLGFVFIKMRRIGLHRAMMTLSFGLGVVFLICYVTYHLTNPSNRFTGEGFFRYLYLFILISHIGLSLVVLPLVLRAMYFSWQERFAEHRRVARFAFPIWLYVSVTGVLVYAFVYHLFPAQ
jgi:putative membrane protein